MSMEDSTVHGEAPCLTAKPKSQTIKHHTKGIPTKSSTKGLNKNGRTEKWLCVFCPLVFSVNKPFSQFTVLDEDTLCELVSFFEDLLIVDVSHGGDEALEKEQNVSHA